MPGGPHPPDSVIQAWPKPNYEHPQTQGNSVLVVVGLFGALALIAVFLRFWSRFKLQRNVGLDDWIFLAAMPFVLAYAIGACLATKVFLADRHIWDMPPEGVPPLRKCMFLQCVFYIFSTCMIKASVLCFYRRLTDRSISAVFIYTVWTIIVLEGVQLILCISLLCFRCRPPSAYWYNSLQTWSASHKYTCVPEGPAIFSMSVVSVIQDLITTAMPFTLFLGMNISKRQKIALSCTFAGGLGVCAVGIYRAFVIHAMYYETFDMTWMAYRFVTASSVEILLATIVASAPALKYYIRHMIDIRRASLRNSEAKAELLMETNGSTGSTITYIESDIGDMGFYEALNASAEKRKVRTTSTDMHGLQVDISTWQHGRSMERLEEELVLEGIIDTKKKFPYFDPDHCCMVTTDPRSVHYPWVDSEPKEDEERKS